MAAVKLGRSGEIAYREAIPDGVEGGDPLLLIHGFPQSSYMWAPIAARIAESGRRAVAPDLVGYGDSPASGPGTWEAQVEALERFRRAVGLERVVLGVHDWGGMIGLRWGCDHPEAVSGLILSNTGFFSDAEWHELARAMRTPGQGEQLLDNLTKEAFAALLRDAGGRLSAEAIDEYFKAFERPEGRRGMLELYRSGDFDKLRPYDGQLGAMGLPTLVMWGANDPTVPLAAGQRFHAEIPDSKLVVLEDASHFLYDDDSERCAEEIVCFLEEREPGTTA